MNYTTNSDVQRAVDTVFHVVFDESLNNSMNLELFYALYVSIDKSIFRTQTSISHYFVKNSYFFVVLLTMLEKLMINFQMSKLALHTLIDLR